MAEVLIPEAFNHQAAVRPSSFASMDGLQRYDLEEIIGEGSYGIVWKAKDLQSGNYVAAKFVLARDAPTRREIECAASLSHPNIVRVHDVVPLEHANKICLVMEYMNGGDLLQVIEERPLNEAHARSLFRQVVEAVHHCHLNGVCHRDLKLENILVDRSRKVAKLIDFGFACSCSSGRLISQYFGSPLYASPEIYMKCPYTGPEVDCWALGVILYAMNTGMFPWPGRTMQEQIRQACKGKFVISETASPDLCDLITKLLRVHPRKRASTIDVLNHPWLQV